MGAEGELEEGELVAVAESANLPFNGSPQATPHPRELFRRLPVLRVDRDGAGGGNQRVIGKVHLHSRAGQARQRLAIVGPRGQHPIELGGRLAIPPLPQEGDREPVPLVEVPRLFGKRPPGEALRLVEPVAPPESEREQLPRFPIGRVSRDGGFQNRHRLRRPAGPKKLRPERWRDLRAKGRVGGNRGLIGQDRLGRTVSRCMLVPLVLKPPCLFRAIRRQAGSRRGSIPCGNGARPPCRRKDGGHHHRQERPIAPIPLRHHFLSVFHRVIFGRRRKYPTGVKRTAIVDIRAQ